MLFDYVFVEVVILINKVIPWKGGLQQIVPDDEEVELELKAVALAILQLDVASSILEHIELFDTNAFHTSLPLVH